MKRILLLLALVLACAASAAAELPRDTLVFVVRHSEKAKDAGDDPPLTAAGEARARALADALADAGVSAIYSTDTRRTRATAQPLAERLDVAIGTYDASDPRILVRELRALPRGLSVLVVGHSNTVPALVAALADAEIPAIEDSDYSRLYVVAIPAQGRARLMRLVLP